MHEPLRFLCASSAENEISDFEVGKVPHPSLIYYIFSVQLPIRVIKPPIILKLRPHVIVMQKTSDVVDRDLTENYKRGE